MYYRYIYIYINTGRRISLSSTNSTLACNLIEYEESRTGEAEKLARAQGVLAPIDPFLSPVLYVCAGERQRESELCTCKPGAASWCFLELSLPRIGLLLLFGFSLSLCDVVVPSLCLLSSRVFWVDVVYICIPLFWLAWFRGFGLFLLFSLWWCGCVMSLKWIVYKFLIVLYF